VDDESFLKVALAALDPVRTLRGPGLGGAGLPKYVVSAWNVYQRNGLRVGFHLFNPFFKGRPVPGAKGVGPSGVQYVTKEVEEIGEYSIGMDHLQIQKYAKNILDAVIGVKF
jgi:hypothetical protein